MNNKFFKNTTWLIMGQVIQMILQFVVGTLSARYLGPSNYGTLSYVGSFITFFTSFCELGMNGVIISELVNHRKDEGKIITTCILMRLAVSIISIFAVILLVMVTDPGDIIVFYITLISSLQIPFAAFNTINYWFQFRLESKYAAIIKNVAYIISAGYKLFLLATGKSVLWFAFANVIDIILLAIMYVISYLLKKEKKNSLGWSKPVAVRMIKGCLPFIIASIMIQIYQQTDKIMIKQMLNSTTEVGLYTAVTTICSLIGFIPTAILDSARPVIMEMKQEDEKKYQLRTRQLFAVLIWFDVLYAIGITIFAKLVIYILYGEAYLAATKCLRICVWYTAFSYLGSARSMWLICEKKNRYAFIFSAMGAGFNVAMNILLIPILGINGAALATLVTQFSANIAFPYLFKDTRPYCYSVIEAFFLRNIELRRNLLLGKERLCQFMTRNAKKDK